jgi:hypothetical protein
MRQTLLGYVVRMNNSFDASFIMAEWLRISDSGNRLLVGGLDKIAFIAL